MFIFIINNCFPAFYVHYLKLVTMAKCRLGKVI